jgi:hypothetical protein
VDIEKNFNEKSHAYIAGKFYQYFIEIDKKIGTNAFINATQYYAEQRGRRMALRAIRDGKDLDFETYLSYGEWVSTDYSKKIGQANDNQLEHKDSSVDLYIHTCPWNKQFEEMGSIEAGRVYCKYLDSSISRGFNPDIEYKVEQTLYNNPVCIHRINDEELNSKLNISRNEDNILPFSFHCSHIYWSFAEVSSSVFALEGQAINQKVLEDLAKDYDDNMVEVILSYKDHNFNTLGTR